MAALAKQWCDYANPYGDTGLWCAWRYVAAGDQAAGREAVATWLATTSGSNFNTIREEFIEKAVTYARQLGYTVIEFAPFTMNNDARAISPGQRSEVRAQAEAAGLEVVGLHWLLAFTEGYYLTSPDEQVRKRTGEYLGELARLCRDLGGKVLVLGSPMQRNLKPLGITHDEGMKYAADTVARAVPAFEECQLTLAIEPLGPEEGDFLNQTEQGIEIAQAID